MKTFGKKVALWPKEKLEKVAHKETFGKKGSSHGSLWKKGSTKDFDKCPVNLLEKKEPLSKRSELRAGFTIHGLKSA